MEWETIDTAPKGTGLKVEYILIANEYLIPDIVCWMDERPGYSDFNGNQWLSRPSGWFSVNGGRSRLDGKATHWMRLPKNPKRENK